jgi:SLOG cluster3 family
MKKTLFLSASVPNEKQPDFLEGGNFPHAVDEAVTTLVRSCLRHETTLVFGGHPTISRVVAPIVLEKIRSEATDEPLLYIYQSEVYRGQLPEETEALSREGAARIIWTAAVADDDERFSRSLALMRQQMIRERTPEAMVCVGGMQGVVDELEEFRRQFPDRRVYVVSKTGGAAALLARERPGQVEVIESAKLDRIFATAGAPTGEARATMGNELQSKRLDHLQAIISRMADNSFKLKGWCLTLVSALLGLALKTDSGAAPTSQIAFFALLPTVVFWLLDAYYLALERGFRDVYNTSAKNPDTAGQEISPPKMTLGRTLNVARDPVTAALYIALLVTDLVVGFGGAAKVLGWLRQWV